MHWGQERGFLLLGRRPTQPPRPRPAPPSPSPPPCAPGPIVAILFAYILAFGALAVLALKHLNYQRR